MDAARDLLRRASRTATALELDGEPLTVERVKAAMSAGVRRARRELPTTSSSRPAPQGAVGHDMGSGPIRAGVPIVIDIWPRDNESFVFCDMTRTFVVGDVPDEVREWHRLCKEALDRAVSEIKAGADGRSIFDGTCEIFEAAGEPTPAHEEAGRAARGRLLPRARPRRRARGARGAGHGARRRRRRSSAGDVVTVEPGLYRQGYGGVRLEDLVLVTEDGAENLTQLPVRPRAVSRARTSTRCSSRSGAIRRRRSSPRRRTRSPAIYDEDFEAFWEREGRERVTWFEPFTKLLRVGAAVREVVPRRQAQRRLQLRRPARRGRARRQGRLPLGGRAGRRARATSPTPTCSAR